MRAKSKALILGFSVLCLAGIPAWLFFVPPQFPRYAPDFSYSVDVVSSDNFYDEDKKVFLGPQLSKTKFYYETKSQDKGVLTIQNVFDVRKMTGEKIFTVERLYGIDAKTGQHVKGFGDRDRSGYLFAPKNLKKQDYVTWHINYNEPAPMKFRQEEKINDLTVYRYEADYHADQTKNLGFLPGVPDKRGVELDIDLQSWIEPLSGRMIKYEDKTTAYYYDQKTKERLHPWNKFNNRYSTSSIDEQVESAKKDKQKIIFNERLVPGLLAGAAFLLFSLFIFPSKQP